MASLAVVPLALAAGLAFLALLRQRGSQYRAVQLAILSLMVVAAAWLTAPRHAGEARVVFVLDGGQDVASARTELARVLSAARTAFERSVQPLAAFDQIIAAFPPGAAVPAVCPEAKQRSWMDASAGGSLPDGRVGAYCAIDRALERFEQRRPWERAADLLHGRALRIVLIVTDPKHWTIRDPDLAAKLTARAAHEGVRIDLVVHGESDAMLADPRLNIIPPPIVSSNAEPNDRITLTLELSYAGLKGSHFAPASSSCVIDNGLPSSAKWSESGSFPVVDGTLRQIVRLNAFRGSDQQLQLLRGYHRVDCTVTLNGKKAAEASSYLKVVRRHIIVVAEDSSRFRGRTAPTTTVSKLLLEKPDATLHASSPLWPPEVVTQTKSPADFEKDLRRESQTLTLAIDQPLMIVMHDVSAAHYRAWCPALDRLVRRGVHLFISGAPPETVRDACPFLPATSTVADAQTNGEWRYDRSPSFFVDFDWSREGKLPYSPTGPGAAVAAGDLKAVFPKLELDGVRAQQQILAGVPMQPAFRHVQVGAIQYDKDPKLDACTMIEKSSLKQRLGPAIQAAIATPNDIAINHVDILFAYDVPQPDPDAVGAELVELLEHGHTVALVVLSNPFTSGVSASTRGAKSSWRCAGYKGAFLLSKSGNSPPAFVKLIEGLIEKRHASHGRGLLQPEEINRRLQVIYVDPASPDSRKAATARLTAIVAPRQEVKSAFIAPNRFGRLIDARLGAALPERLAPGIHYPPVGQRWAAPAYFQHLQTTAGFSIADAYASAYHDPQDPEALDPRPLIVSSNWGAGTVTVAGYSLFEGLVDASPFGRRAQADSTSVIARRFENASTEIADTWSIRRLVEPATFVGSLEPSVGPEPVLSKVSIVDDAVQLELLEQIRNGEPVTDPRLKRCEGSEFISNCGTSDVEGTTMVLTAIDRDRQLLTYRLLPNAASKICGVNRAACIATLEGVPFYVGSDTKVAPSPLRDISAAELLVVLSRFSGGDVVTGANDVGGLRPFAVSRRSATSLAMLALMAAYWIVRLFRRLNLMRLQQQETNAELSKGRTDTAEGLAAAAGEVEARPSSEVRVGAFAGFRAVDPGDRLSNLNLDDLMMMTDETAPALIPRVIRRIDERARRLIFFVNVGASMRVPALRRRSPVKIVAAARAVDILAGLAWRGGAEVMVIAYAAPTHVLRLGPLSAPPAQGQIERFLVGARQRGQRWRSVPDIGEIEDGSIVFVISDFINEDLGALKKRAAVVEDARGTVGFLHVFSRSEELLLDAGYASTADLICDRAECTRDELRDARRALQRRLSRALDGTVGGVASVSADMTAQAMLFAIRDSRLITLVSR